MKPEFVLVLMQGYVWGNLLLLIAIAIFIKAMFDLWRRNG